jgi:hypothetical protein
MKPLTRAEVVRLKEILDSLVVDEWISTKEALAILRMRSSEYLLWLTESGHVTRRPRDGRSWEYLQETVEEATRKIQSREIVLPNPNKKAA